MEIRPDERPAYVRFEKRPVEDRDASIKTGHYVGRDVDFVLITPPGSKDQVEKPVSDWLAQLKVAVKDGRMPAGLEARYVQAYEFWKRGEEIPLEGTAIKGWPVLSPSQQKTCIEGANLRTVEDLALANGEAITRLGMGGYEMKQKAEAWLKAAKNLGTVASENAALRVENARLKTENEGLAQRVTNLQAEVKRLEIKVPA